MKTLKGITKEVAEALLCYGDEQLPPPNEFISLDGGAIFLFITSQIIQFMGVAMIFLIILLKLISHFHLASIGQ